MLSKIQQLKQAHQQIRKCQSWLLPIGETKVVEDLDSVCDRIEKRIEKEAS